MLLQITFNLNEHQALFLFSTLYVQAKFEMQQHVGVGASKFLGVRRLFARISPNLPESYCATSPTNFLPQRSRRPLFGVTSKKRSSVAFRKTVGVIFAQIFRNFAQSFDNSNLWGCAWTAVPYINPLWVLHK